MALRTAVTSMVALATCVWSACADPPNAPPLTPPTIDAASMGGGDDAADPGQGDAAIDADMTLDPDTGAMPGPPMITLGPLLGAITDQSVKVWLRSDRPCRFAVRYHAVGDTDDITSDSTRLLAEHDFTGVVSIAGLSANTEHSYRIVMIAQDGTEELDTVDYTFRTLPAAGAPLSLRFTVGADLNSANIPAFNDMAAMDPDFMLLIGDNIYADHVDPTLAAYRAQYRFIWGGEQFRDFMSHVPLFMTWDDHEVINDYWQGKNPRFTPGSAAFHEYQASHNPEPLIEDELFYTFSAGDVDFFMLETRSNRSNNMAEDDENKTMLGEAQVQALESWLLTSQARFKILVTSVMWADFGNTANDSWFGFRRERQSIIDTIYDNQIEGVVIVSGDQHWSAIFRNSYGSPPLVIYEIEATPLAISNRGADHRTHPSYLFRDDDHQAYGVVDIDTTREPPTIKLTVCAADLPCEPGEEPPPSTAADAPRSADTIPTTISLTLDDMGFVE